MARVEKTVFISYRRTDVYTALAVYENLKNQGYDVFFDYRSISSGDFEQIITSNIKARAHFLLILTPTALDRCNEPGDWLRREIEFAIDEKRNIIPLFFKGFRFGNPSVSEKLTGKLRNLGRYNGLNVHEDYFDEAMHRLRIQYLNIPLETVLHPISTEVLKVVREEQVAADKALEQIEDVKELVKQVDEPRDQPEAKPRPKRKKPVPAVDIPIPSEEIVSGTGTALQNRVARQKRETGAKTQESPVPRELAKSPTPGASLNFPLVGGIAGGLLILGFLIWGASSLFRNSPAATLESTSTFQVNVVFASQQSPTTASQPSKTEVPLPTQTSVPVTKTNVPSATELGIGSTMTGKDGMTLLYVPAGEFTMGDEARDALVECKQSRSDCQLWWFTAEEPPHEVYLDAFWIDKTKVTNKMYASCVAAGACEVPADTSYYGNSDFDSYPVIFVDWNMAKTYCEWAGRRLLTEAEWEKAARGTDGRTYPWGNNAPNKNLLNYNKNVRNITEVNKYPDGASPYGALDMAGNIEEWVADWYSDTYYASSPTSNPLGPTSGQSRVLRGGSWQLTGNEARSASRSGQAPTVKGYSIRCGAGSP